MHKCSMWKPHTNNQPLLFGVPTNKETPEIYNIQSDIRMLLGRDCVVEMVMKYLKHIGVFEKYKIMDS